MKRASGNGKWWVLFVVALGLALWFRLHKRGGDDATPSPPPTPAPAPIDAAVVAPAVDATEVVVPAVDAARPAPPPYESDFYIAALSADGARALLTEGTDFTPKSLRVVDVATGRVETDIAYAAYGAVDGSDRAALVDEMIRTRAVLRGFPFGAGPSFATTADGTAGVLASGDALVSMRGDKLGAQLADAAGYDPMILPDGTVLFRGYHGRVGDEGVYALAWATLDSPAVHFVDGTIDDDGGAVATTAGDTLRIVVEPAAGKPHCVLDVPLVKPYKVTRTHCLADDTLPLAYVISPHGGWVAWQTRDRDDAPTRLRTMNLDTGGVGIDVTDHAGDTLLVTDTGRLLIENLDGDARQIDPATKASSPVVLPHTGIWHCKPRGDRTLVCEDHGSVTVVEL